MCRQISSGDSHTFLCASVLGVVAPRQGQLIKMFFPGISQSIQTVICLGRQIRIAVFTHHRCHRKASLVVKEIGHMCQHLPAARRGIPLMRHFNADGGAGRLLSPHCFNAFCGEWLHCGSCCCCSSATSLLMIKASPQDMGWVDDGVSHTFDRCWIVGRGGDEI